MEIITLYRYTRPDGGVTVSPTKPDMPYTTTCRLIAAAGKALTRDGVHLAPCIDVDSPDDWYEVDAPQDEDAEADEATAQDYQAALKEMGVRL